MSLNYSDGFGRQVQAKRQAAPGPVKDGGPVVDPRWIGSGWTIFNNKGKPVRQYEPFFSATYDFEFAAITGVSPILFYDPVSRVVATLHPNNTYEKVVIDPWRQTSWDVNDTVLLKPDADPDVSGFLVRLPKDEYLPTWYQQQIEGEKGPAGNAIARKARRHANTPMIAFCDSLGRKFLTIADNGKDETGKAQKYSTRTLFDIEANPRVVIDALDRVIAQYDYDMCRMGLHQASIEAGENWRLNDVTGKPIRTWNSRRYIYRSEYDALRRPTRCFVRGGDPYERNACPFPQEILFERTIYGDSVESGLTEHHQREANLRGKIYQTFDGTGAILADRYDFRGNLLHSHRRVVSDYKNLPDWSQDPEFTEEIFASGTTYDALNRTVTITSPDGSVYRPAYDETGRVEKIDLLLRHAQGNGQPVWAPFVVKINYDAKGQRTRIDYANRAATTYEYDEETFRLIHLRSVRPSAGKGVTTQIFTNSNVIQDLYYSYDPVGNIIEIADLSLRIVCHDNHKVDPVCQYTYDPLYRLINATGREHIAQSAFQIAPLGGNYRDYPFIGGRRLNDLQAMRNYTDQYEYDSVGNFLRMIHRAENGSWTRHYTYDEDSLLEPSRKSNRLSRTLLHTGLAAISDRYLYDSHGNVIQMPHLPTMQWDFLDQLLATSRQIVNTGIPETTFYRYDLTGQRTRKVTDRPTGTRKAERLYVGSFEVYREYDGSGTKITKERETLHVMDDMQRLALVETLKIDRGTAVAVPEPMRRYQLANHLGSTTLELDETAELISYEEYAPYGGTVFQVGRSAAEVKSKRYRYTGKERDKENGFTYHGARYYAPWLGRWTATDPGGIAPGFNLYLYVSANPMVTVDSTGFDDDKVIDQSSEYGGTLPPGVAPEPRPPSDNAPPPDPGPPPLSESPTPPPEPAEPSPSPPSNTGPPAANGGSTSGPSAEALTPERESQIERDKVLHLDMDPGEYANKYPDWGMVYMFVWGLAQPFKKDAQIVEATKGTSIRPDRSNLIVGIGQVATFFIPSPTSETTTLEDAVLAASENTPKLTFLENDVEVGYGKNYTRIGNDPQTIRVTNARKSWPGTHDAIVQSEAQGGRLSPGVANDSLPGGWGVVETNEAQIAEAINNNPNLAPGQPIRMLSCALSPEQAQAIANLTQRPVFASPLVVGVESGPGILPAQQFIRWDPVLQWWSSVAEKQVWNLYLPK